MKQLKRILPSRGRAVQASSAVQTSTPNTAAETQGSEPSPQSPITAAIQSSNKDDQPWGLKLLHVGQDSQEPIVDVVAVHGLNGHREGTWTDDNKILWLRDLLPSKLPKARIWTWGYDSRTYTKSHHDHLTIKKLYDHGRELVQDLDGERRDDGSYQRPIIFIAHSLGGIVVKSDRLTGNQPEESELTSLEALLHSDRARQGHLEVERSVKLSTYGIIFMGTPHQGGQGVNVREILLNLEKVRGNTNNSLLKHLGEHSELLQQQNSEFTSISQDFDIRFAYETLPTPIIGGAAKVIVPKWSAVVPGTPDAAEFGISQDHRRMTKFLNSEDQDFRKLSRALASMAQKAEVKIKSNWQSEGCIKKGRQTSYNVPFNIQEVPNVARYVERHREMQNMEAKLLSEEQNKQRRIFVLHGLGGIGKTQLSIAYARKYQNDYSAVFWLNGQSRGSLRQSIAGIADQLPKDQISESARNHLQQGNEQLDKVILEVMGWLSRDGNGQWLLIYDNVDRDDSKTINDPEAFDVNDYLPGSDQGSIIITTRQHRLRSLGDEMSVPKMKMKEGLKVLENRIGSTITDNPQAAELVDLVGGLPLALAQAASYMRETGTNFSGYIEFYNTVWEDLMRDEAHSESRIREYGERSVYTTWTISFDCVKRKNEDAANMLQVWSYLDNKDIRFEIFNNKENSNLKGWSSPPEWFRRVVCDKLSFKRITMTLLDYSLIEARHESDSYEVHPVVHEWCRKTMNADKRHKRAFLAITSVACAVPSYSDRDYWRIQCRLLPHANRFSQQLMDMLERKLESDQANELHTAFHDLGLLYSYGGRTMWGKAEAMYHRAISGWEKSLGSNHENILGTLNNLGVLYKYLGRYCDAEAIHQRVLARRTDHLGPEHKDTLRSICNLANFYIQQNKLVEAENLYQRVLRWYQTTFDPANEINLQLFHDLGILYHKQGKLAESESMYLQALAGYEAILETDHPSRLRTYYNIGSLYIDQERLVEAEATLQRALKACEDVFGVEQADTLNVMHTLGFIFGKQRRLAEAEAIYQQTLAGRINVLGIGDRLTLETLQNLRILYEEQGKLVEAKTLYLQELDLSKDIPDGEKDEHTLDLINDLGVLYKKQGRLAEAEAMYQRALAGYRTVLGPEHESTLHTLNNLRICYKVQGKLAEAEALYLEEVELFKDVRDDQKTERNFDSINDLGCLYAEQGKLAEAEAMFQQALDGYRTLGSEHESISRTVRNLRVCYEKQGKLAEAEALSQEMST